MAKLSPAQLRMLRAAADFDYEIYHGFFAEHREWLLNSACLHGANSTVLSLVNRGYLEKNGQWTFRITSEGRMYLASLDGPQAGLAEAKKQMIELLNEAMSIDEQTALREQLTILQAENALLRDALEAIAEPAPGQWPDVDWYQKIASEALKGREQ